MVGHKDKLQSQETPFFLGNRSWGYDLFCGWKQGLRWVEELREKGSVKQSSVYPTSRLRKIILYIKNNNTNLITKQKQKQKQKC